MIELLITAIGRTDQVLGKNGKMISCGVNFTHMISSLWVNMSSWADHQSKFYWSPVISALDNFRFHFKLLLIHGSFYYRENNILNTVNDQK